MRISVRTRARSFAALHYSLRLLIVITLVLLTWTHFGMNRVYLINAKSSHHFSVKDDRIMGGKTVATLRRTDHSLIMDCQLEKHYEWPFCDLTMQLGVVPDGIDLSDYESVSFDINYVGAGPNFVRFYLRNYEDEISKPTEWLSMKVNQVEFEVPANGKITFPTKLFQVASWWVSERKIPLLHTDMRINNVPFVELSTGSLAGDGLHQIELKSIKFYGKWISQANLLIWLVSAWLVFGISRLSIELLDFRANLAATKRRVAHLVTVLRAKKSKTVSPSETSPILVRIEPEEQMPDPAQLPEPDDPSKAESQTSRSNYLRWISATVGNSLRLILIDDIIYFQSDQKYTRVVLADSEVLIKKSLKELLEELDPEQFWKLHRSIVVNVLEIASIEPNMGGELTVKLKSRREQLPVSDSFVRKFRQM